MSKKEALQKIELILASDKKELSDENKKILLEIKQIISAGTSLEEIVKALFEYAKLISLFGDLFKDS